MPQIRFWIASENANTSRPQPLACDNGVRNNPSVERGPNVSTEIVHPASAMMTGRRHIGILAALVVVAVMGISGQRAP